jgi:hypothetical protein
MVGLESICANTGTLYGISGASYSMWKGNSYPAGAANLTLKKVFAGIAQAVGRGLMEDVTLLVSPLTYSTMANDEAALRQYTNKVGKAERGANAISFYGPAGNVDILPHPMMKDQIALAFPHKKASRIGSQDLSFKRPGSDSELVQEMATQTGFEVRLFSEQALFLPCPSKCLSITGIAHT